MSPGTTSSRSSRLRARPWYCLLYTSTRDGAFTVENFGKFFRPGNLPVVFDSFRLAFFCTVICLLLGYPAAYFLASRNFTRGRAIVVLILLPMWMNFLLRTYAMMTLCLLYTSRCV